MLDKFSKLTKRVCHLTDKREWWCEGARKHFFFLLRLAKKDYWSNGKKMVWSKTCRIYVHHIKKRNNTNSVVAVFYDAFYLVWKSMWMNVFEAFYNKHNVSVTFYAKNHPFAFTTLFWIWKFQRPTFDGRFSIYRIAYFVFPDRQYQ